MAKNYEILDNLVKINSYARFRNVSYTAVSLWAKQGRVEVVSLDGTLYVVLKDEEKDKYKSWVKNK